MNKDPLDLSVVVVVAVSGVSHHVFGFDIGRKSRPLVGDELRDQPGVQTLLTRA
jgi:hypothetical protein